MTARTAPTNLAKPIIAYISWDSFYGRSKAADVHTSQLAQALLRHDYEVNVIMSGQNTMHFTAGYHSIIAETPDITGNPLTKFVSLIRKNWRLYNQTLKYSRDAQILYERHNSGSVVGLALSLRLHKPLYYELNTITAAEALIMHGVRNRFVYVALDLLVAIELRRAKAVIVQTEELKEIVEGRYRIHNVYVVPNGTEAHEGSRRRPRKRNEVIKATYLGTVDAYHDIDKILAMFANLEHIAELRVVGDGPELAKLKKKYEGAGIEFYGVVPHDEVFTVMGDSDIGIAAYNTQSELFRKYGFYFCPLKLLEYAAFGMPTVFVGWRNSFVSEFERAGACVVVEGSDGLREVIRQFIDCPSRLLAMSEAASAMARKYSWDEAARKTAAVFEERS